MSQMLNETLRQRRKAIKLTQEQLAERVHVSRQTISNWETGRANPDYEMLKLLSDVLETPLTELLGVEEEAPTEKPAPEAEAAPEPLPETPVQPRTDGRFSRWHMVLLLAAAFLMVLAVQGLIGWWQHRPVPSPYPPEWFMEETPAAAGQACITMSVLETPIRPIIASPEDGYRWEYSVYVRETGGVGFTIERLIDYTFWSDGGHTVTETSGSALRSSSITDHVSANAVCYFTAGDASNRLILGRGILLEGTDDNGNPVTARCYVPYAPN